MEDYIMLQTQTTALVTKRSETTVFPPSHWKHVLKLLGLIIVADGKVRKLIPILM
jgi:hypothetical protein